MPQEMPQWWTERLEPSPLSPSSREARYPESCRECPIGDAIYEPSLVVEKDGTKGYVEARYRCRLDHGFRSYFIRDFRECWEHGSQPASSPKAPSAPRPEPARGQATKTQRRTSRPTAVSGRLRYEILRRDGFRCQACGRGAEVDGVALHVDHQQPISKGGTSDPENLWTFCVDCNLGKSDTL